VGVGEGSTVCRIMDEDVPLVVVVVERVRLGERSTVNESVSPAETLVLSADGDCEETGARLVVISLSDDRG
jgi:hypothetical protein